MEENSTQNPIQPQPTQQAKEQLIQASTTPHKSAPSKWLSLGVGFTLILILLGGAYFLGKNSASKTQVAVNETNTITPTPTIDETTNWKTYTNSDLTFKYPNTLTVSSNNIIQGTNSNIRIFIADKNSPLMNECMQPTATQNINGTYIRKFTRITTGAMCETTDSTPRENWIVPTVDGFSPGISFTYSVNEETKALNIFNQILSTFKFTNQTSQINEKTKPTPTPITNAWKLYSDSKYRFSFKLPNDWNVQVKDYPENNQRLINIIKNSSPTVVSLSFTISNSWANTGDAQNQPKNYTVGGVPAYRIEPPTPTERKLDRYQTNVYFENNGQVYVFVCTHNWNSDYLGTCNNLLSTVNF